MPLSTNTKIYKVQWNSLVAQTVESACNAETRVQSLGQEDPLEKDMVIHSSILAWKIPWMEKPGRLQPTGSQSWTWLSNFTYNKSSIGYAFLVAQLVKNHLPCWRSGFHPWVGKIPWRREQLPTPVFWPGEFHGLYSPWGHKSQI